MKEIKVYLILIAIFLNGNNFKPNIDNEIEAMEYVEAL